MYPIPPGETLVENKVCRQCQTTFPITDKDMEFYAKVSPSFPSPGVPTTGGEVVAPKKYQIPPPTLCPECRQQRRQLFKNIYHLYKDEKTWLISAISPDKWYNVVAQDAWWNDADLWLQYGRAIRFDLSFLSQFYELQKVAPRWNLIQLWSENCEWCINISNSHNCYYVKSGWWDENCYYWERVFESKDTLDGVRIDNTSNCYDSYEINNCHNIFFSKNVSNARDCIYVTDCQNISDCIGCTGLYNKMYHILNKPVTQIEYEAVSKKIITDTKYREYMIDQYEILLARFPRKAITIESSEKTYGNDIFNSKNVYYGFGIRECEDVRYIYDGAGSQDIMDANGDDLWSLSYECSSNYKPYNTSFSFNNAEIKNCYYTETCINLDHCFGCVGLHDKSYCILNKQYTKEEYEELVPKIIEKMMKDGEWWEFFPASMSPYGYNESEANEYYPLEKSEALSSGFNWSDYEVPFPIVEKIIPAEKLPDTIEWIPDDILNWAIESEVSKKPFRIIKQELEFYRKHNLPIPRRHPDVRHADRMKMRNPRKLFERKCDKCMKDMITTYSPERPETVYCEECYNREVMN
jgi:hypothetical protein